MKIIAAFKKAEVPPLYKNNGGADKSNYRPISIISNVSKIYERCLIVKLYNYFNKNIFPKYQRRFCKDFSAKHALLIMIEQMKTTRDNKILRGYSHKIIEVFCLYLSQSPDC